MTYEKPSLLEQLRLRCLQLKDQLHNQSRAPRYAKEYIRFYLLDCLRHNLVDTIITDVQETETESWISASTSR